MCLLFVLFALSETIILIKYGCNTHFYNLTLINFNYSSQHIKHNIYLCVHCIIPSAYSLRFRNKWAAYLIYEEYTYIVVLHLSNNIGFRDSNIIYRSDLREHKLGSIIFESDLHSNIEIPPLCLPRFLSAMHCVLRKMMPTITLNVYNVI